MKELGKRLVEVELILNKLDDKYKKMIPNKFWDFIKTNKDNYYSCHIDFEISKIHIDTISILTYINKEYLMKYDEKVKMNEILRIDNKMGKITF